MLGQIFEKAEHGDIAARYYARIVKDYPLSPLVGDAKNKLVKFGVPVPPADPTAVARMQKEQAADRPGFVKRSMTVLKTGPNVSAAARSGDPTMTPASESGDETIGFGLQPNAALAAPSSIGSTATVQTITPGSSQALPDPAPSASSTDTTTPAATDATPSTDASPSTDATPAAGTGTTTDSSTTAPAAAATTPPPADSGQESSSKKKSGLRKLIPF
jgi:hypothetical protein